MPLSDDVRRAGESHSRFFQNEAGLSYAEAHRLLSYDHETGHFWWQVNRSACRAGDLAGSIAQSGYWRIKINKIQFLAHRVAWLMYYGAWPSDILDHIDRDGTNNKINNLRLANKKLNSYNRRCLASASGLRGVRRQDHNNKWDARIRVDHKRIYLGYFDTAEEAHAAYVAAAKIYHGDFASFDSVKRAVPTPSGALS